MAQERPGIMVYFEDVLPSLAHLSLEDAGRLFIAMLKYGRDGAAPDFGDHPGLNIAWSFIRPKIDRDNASYGKAVLKSKYGVYKRECNKRGDICLDFDEWYQQIYNPSQPSSSIMSPSSPIMGTYPTGTSNRNKQLQPQPQLATGKNVFSVGGDRAGAREEEDNEVNVYLQDRHLDPFFTFGVEGALKEETTRFADAVFKKFTCRRPTAADYSNVFWCISLREHDDATDTWKITLPQELKDLLMYAFEQANKAGRPGDWNYINGVLANLNKRGITTMDAAEDYDIERAERS